MFLLSVVILRVMIVHAVRVFVLRMGLVVVMMVSVLILPKYLLVMTHHWPQEMVERVRVMMTSAMPVAIYIRDRSFLTVVVICDHARLDRIP